MYIFYFRFLQVKFWFFIRQIRFCKISLRKIPFLRGGGQAAQSTVCQNSNPSLYIVLATIFDLILQLSCIWNCSKILNIIIDFKSVACLTLILLPSRKSKSLKTLLQNINSITSSSPLLNLSCVAKKWLLLSLEQLGQLFFEVAFHLFSKL